MYLDAHFRGDGGHPACPNSQLRNNHELFLLPVEKQIMDKTCRKQSENLYSGKLAGKWQGEGRANAYLGGSPILTGREGAGHIERIGSRIGLSAFCASE